MKRLHHLLRKCTLFLPQYDYFMVYYSELTIQSCKIIKINGEWKVKREEF